jgi:hypothetical protein
MLNYDEMIKCGQKYAFEKKQMSIAKYKEFVSYLKKIINITFGDNEKEIASYLKETSDQSLLLDWNVGGIHYDGFHIGRLTNEMINVVSLRAHDAYYDPVLELESEIDNEELLSFFEKEYKRFIDLFVPCYYFDENNVNTVDESHSLVCIIANKFNEVCFNHFQIYFQSLGIDDMYSFNRSKFSLKFTDERRYELDKEVYECYNSYTEKVTELTKKFDESVKDLK